MNRKRRKNVSFRNNNRSFLAILGDNKKYLMPAILVVAVIATVSIAVSANKRTVSEVQTSEEATEAATFEIPENAMEENAYPEVNALIEKYYTAAANGDADTISEIYKGLDDTELLKTVAASEYIEKFENITVYTKPGPKEGSYVAYVYNEVKLYDYDKDVPGFETMYICTDDSGNLYIDVDIADQGELDYLKQVNVQADVIDLNNKVASSYNEMVNSDEKLAELLTRMRSGLQVSVGEALATAEASTEASSADDASSEESTEPQQQTITRRVIKATDVINIRNSDSETADILDKTEKGQEFKELEALANGWSKVEYKGKTAYVKTEFFDVVSEETVAVDNSDADDAGKEEENSDAGTGTDTAGDDSKDKDKDKDKSDASKTEESGKVDSSAKTGDMVLTDSVKLRKGQSTETDALMTIYAGSTVKVIEQYSNGWAKVEYNKNTGYIKSEFIRQ
ncbi:MAG: SH3 domain-containing protein [Butyrivibrio sp.]|nr:SH3 domain-containing protein [Butyrivibrio sp.]